jgi:hypothetical protein
MSKILGRIAAIGLGIGIVSLGLAYAVGGGDFDRLVNRSGVFAEACGDGAAPASERRLAWTGGDAIDIALPATVHFRGGEGNEIVLRGPPDIITLPGQPFRRVNVSGSGRLSMENFNQPELTLRISGSGTLRGQGSVDQLSVVISGSGTARLAGVAVKQLTAKISGSGNLEAAPKDDADISISGSGNVRLLSRPTRLKSHVAGSGRITQASIDTVEGKK